MYGLIERLIIAFRKLKEQFYIFLLETRQATRWTITVLALISGFLGTVLLIIYFGFPLNENGKALVLQLVRVVFAIYVVNYLIRLLYATRRWAFIISRPVESFLIGLLIIDFLTILFAGDSMFRWVFAHTGLKNYMPFYIAFLQIYLLLLVFIELSKFSQWLLALRVNPALLLVGSFIILISLCTLLLLLPEMTVSGHIRFVDALFTAVSATCVTGLTVVDTAEYFTVKGQLVIMIFIQLGGLGIVSFATFFAAFARRGITFEHGIKLREQLALETVSDLFSLIKTVIAMTILFELAGAALIFLSWGELSSNMSIGERVFYSLFHAISAFCNAGFTLFKSSLEDPVLSNNLQLVAIIGFLFFIGGLGFPAVRDLFSPDEVKDRLAKPWKRIRTSTFIALTVSGALLLTGMVFISLFEWNKALSGLHWGEKLIHALFQSATARTAGFSTIPINSLSVPTLLILIFLMFIGASSGSTGGGIKTSTFFVVLMTLRSIFLNKPVVEFRNRSIPIVLQQKAFAVLFMSVFLIMLGTLLLSIFEPHISLVAILFEVVSAYGTVGLSTGITPYLSDFSKLVLSFLMLVGKLGPLTVAFALTGAEHTPHSRYPATNIMIG